MDEQVRRDIAQVEPEVAFRAETGYRHATWAGTWHSRPELYLRPRTVAEVRKIVDVARRCGRHIVTVGAGHSPSDLTCTSSWLVSLDGLDGLVSLDEGSGLAVMEGGMRLWQVQEALAARGWTMPTIGSIVDQSIAGAIATGTHGSSLAHGLLSDAIVGLKIVTADGRLRSCSRDDTDGADLFRAALVSLGALGIIVEVTFQAVPDFRIHWTQSLRNLSWILRRWDRELWTDSEFVRLWWMPYTKKCVYWRADRTGLPLSEPSGHGGFLAGKLGYHSYQIALWISNYIPRLVPLIERLVGRIQYGLQSGGGGGYDETVPVETAVQWARDGMKLDCLYSQFVNEWAIPLARGPEALTRLSAWLHGDSATANIPFSSAGVYVHAPIEVRVADGRRGAGPRAFLDPTEPDGPTLYLNAILYRPYHCDPPCTRTYYAAFEHLMRELGGRPHWAKNFAAEPALTISRYPHARRWLEVREEVDPQGMFFGDWHRRNLLPYAWGASGSAVLDDGNNGDSGATTPTQEKAAAAASRSWAPLDGTAVPGRMPLEEHIWATGSNGAFGGRNYYGEIAGSRSSASPPASEGSFELMDHNDAEMSVMLESKYIED